MPFKEEFPIFKKYPNLVYLDNSASSLKPQCVIDKLNEYYNEFNCNVHRGVYNLSFKATDMYENARQIIADFLGAEFHEIVFTRGASQSLNLVATSYGNDFINEGDEILTSELEHHSSHMPWFNICQKKKAILKYITLTESGRITVENFKNALTPKTKVVSITMVSNVLGYITPLKEIIKICHERGIIVNVDAAQAIPHMKVDVKDLDCDFLSFSGHKMYGPFGIGVLYGKKKMLEKLNPIEFGGDMADIVTKNSQNYKEIPYKFETGTPPIAEAIACAEACLFMKKIGIETIENYEKKIINSAVEAIKTINEVELYNDSFDSAILSFNIKGIHPHDVASIFDKNQVCIRAGNHCCQLIMNFLEQISTIRASMAFYNDDKDIEIFIDSIKEAITFFKKF